MATIRSDPATNLTLSYSCDAILQYNRVTPIEVDFLYDLAFAGNDSISAVAQLESQLLDRVAKNYTMFDGRACTRPPPLPLQHIVQISSLPIDQPNPQYDSCFLLKPSNSSFTCLSLKGSMVAKVAGRDDELEFLDLVAQTFSKLQETSSAGGSDFEVQFLGTQIDSSQTESGRDNLAAPINTGELNFFVPEERNKRFTAWGILFVVALVGAFCGVLFVLVRWRRNRNEQLRQQQILLAEQPEDNHNNGGNGVKEFQDEHDDNNGAYDLGDYMKNEMLNKHAPTPTASNSTGVKRQGPPPTTTGRLSTRITSSVAASRAMNGSGGVATTEDVLSESDVDSWAQTDATLGSLEVRLESITAEV